jgi:hypothetical protein
MFDPNTFIQKTPGGTGAEQEYVWLKNLGEGPGMVKYV